MVNTGSHAYKFPIDPSALLLAVGVQVDLASFSVLLVVFEKALVNVAVCKDYSSVAVQFAAAPITLPNLASHFSSDDQLAAEPLLLILIVNLAIIEGIFLMDFSEPQLRLALHLAFEDQLS